VVLVLMKPGTHHWPAYRARLPRPQKPAWPEVSPKRQSRIRHQSGVSILPLYLVPRTGHPSPQRVRGTRVEWAAEGWGNSVIPCLNAISMQPRPLPPHQQKARGPLSLLRVSSRAKQDRIRWDGMAEHVGWKGGGKAENGSPTHAGKGPAPATSCLRLLPHIGGMRVGTRCPHVAAKHAPTCWQACHTCGVLTRLTARASWPVSILVSGLLDIYSSRVAHKNQGEAGHQYPTRLARRACVAERPCSRGGAAGMHWGVLGRRSGSRREWGPSPCRKGAPRTSSAEAALPCATNAPTWGVEGKDGRALYNAPGHAGPQQSSLPAGRAAAVSHAHFPWSLCSPGTNGKGGKCHFILHQHITSLWSMGGGWGEVSKWPARLQPAPCPDQGAFL